MKEYLLPIIREAVANWPEEHKDERPVGVAILQTVEFIAENQATSFYLPRTESEQRAIKLGTRASAYFRRFPSDARLVDIIPNRSRDIGNEEWEQFCLSFTPIERRYLTRALRALSIESRRQNLEANRHRQPLQTIGDVAGFDFQGQFVQGIGRVYGIFLKTAFRLSEPPVVGQLPLDIKNNS